QAGRLTHRKCRSGRVRRTRHGASRPHRVCQHGAAGRHRPTSLRRQAMTTTNPVSGGASTPSPASAPANPPPNLPNTSASFLKLLTPQLQHQDPLSPMDSNQFVSQLVSFAGVEQQIAQNSNLEKLIALQSTGITSGSLGYMGKTVEAVGESNQLANGEARF